LRSTSIKEGMVIFTPVTLTKIHKEKVTDALFASKGTESIRVTTISSKTMT
jgi:hypothetical protein